MGDTSAVLNSASNTQVVRRLLAFSWRYRLRTATVFALQVGVIGLTLGALGLTGVAVDVLMYAVSEGAPEPRWPLWMSPPPSWSSLEMLAALGASVLLVAALRAIVNYLYSVQVAHLVHMEVVPQLRTELYDKLQRLSFRFFDSHSSGSIINRLTRDVQMLRSFIDGVVIQAAVLALTLGFFLAYMLSRHAALTLASLAPTPLLYLVTTLFLRWARPAYRQERRLADRVVRTMAECIEGILIIKTFGREEEQRTRFAKKNQDLRDQQLGIFKNVSRFSPMVDFLGQLNIVVLLAYGGTLVARGAITLGDLVVFAGLLQQFASRVSEMAGIINTLQQSITGAKRVFDVLDSRPEVESPPDGLDLDGTECAVRFENVSFGHGDKLALENVSFEVEPGRCLGIVGATGAGKSTLLRLIPRFYDPTQGTVYVNGFDLRRLNLESLRRHVGVVFQESFLFRDTVAENIAFGSPDASRAQIERAAQVAGAHDFIRSLPRGYDTLLEENALDLSGGQRQRLAIARALLLDPPILLLDDPTAAIDPVTAAEVLDSIQRAAHGRTTIIVSNRPSILRSADELIVLDRGRILQQGAGSEVMTRGILSAIGSSLSSFDREPTADAAEGKP